MQSGRKNKDKSTKPSITAVSVAMALSRSIATDNIFAFSKLEGFLSDHLSKEGRKSLRGFNWCLAQYIAHTSYAKQQSFFDKHVIPGYDTRIALRKLMIKQKVEQAIARGVKQIVIFGGGFDIRGLITANMHPGVHVFELDRDPIRQSKLNALASIPRGNGFDHLVFTRVSSEVARICTNMNFLHCDLAIHDPARLLDVSGFDHSQPSLIIAEGLTVYLDEEANRKLLATIHSMMTQDSELLISYISEIVYPDLVKKVQTKSNELYQFTLPPESVIQFASESGFDVAGKFDGANELIQVDPENADLSQHKQNIPIEVYFSMRELQHEPRQSLSDVPDMNVELPDMKEPLPLMQLQ